MCDQESDKMIIDRLEKELADYRETSHELCPKIDLLTIQNNHLRADLARVTSERDEARKLARKTADERDLHHSNENKLSADNARLREAVEDLSFELNALVPFLSIHGLEVSGYLRHIAASEAAIKEGK